VSDGNLVSKPARDKFVQLDWVARCHGWNIITTAGTKAIDALALRRVDLRPQGDCGVGPDRGV